MRIFLYLIIVPFYLSSCREYSDHYSAEHREGWDGAYISFTSFHAQIAILPDKNESKKIVRSFDRAQKRIWVEIYTWTEKETLDALIRAHWRGVDTRVILEGNVYGTPRINNDSFARLQNAGIDVIYADNDRYNFTHAKFWMIDDTYCVSTGNLTSSLFQKNRDFIVCDAHPDVLSTLSILFIADQKKELPIFPWMIPMNIFISPIDMRSRLNTLLQKAQKTLYVYVQSAYDAEILILLQKQYTKWIDVRLCVSDGDGIGSIVWYSFPIVYMQKPYLHAKAIMIDHTAILMGSINLTKNAIDNNREVALLYEKSPEMTKVIESRFMDDCFPQKFAK